MADADIVATVVDVERWRDVSATWNCAWCEKPYTIPDDGLVLWVSYDYGYMRVCSEVCAIQVRQEVNAGLWPNGPYHNSSVLRSS